MTSENSTLQRSSYDTCDLSRVSSCAQVSFRINYQSEDKITWLQQRINCFDQVHTLCSRKQYTQAIETLKTGYVKTFHYCNQDFLDGIQYRLKQIIDSILQQLLILTLGKPADITIYQLRCQIEQDYQKIEDMGMTNDIFREFLEKIEKLDNIFRFYAFSQQVPVDQPSRINLKSKLSYVTNSLDRKINRERPTVIQLGDYQNNFKVSSVKFQEVKAFDKIHFNMENRMSLSDEKTKLFQKPNKMSFTDLKIVSESKLTPSSLRKGKHFGFDNFMKKRNQQIFDQETRLVKIRI